MHKSVVLFAALAASGLVAEAAWAKNSFPVKFVTFDQLAATCKKTPGAFMWSQSGGSYGCNGAGSVACDSNTKTCTGTTPTRTAPGTVTGVLTGTAVVVSTGKPSKGDGVLGTGILEGGGVLGTQGPATAGTPVRAPTAPSAPPVIIR